MTLPRSEGKTAIVTGAAMGMGEATARLFAEAGAHVVVADFNEEKRPGHRRGHRRRHRGGGDLPQGGHLGLGAGAGDGDRDRREVR
ncbi:SDR family NAD(P)-dependent oxidoreductase [Corynebacterium suedekumii]|nr:SDR family NAD(P)-dependent oxidoreductase [Corynebacterium suedekumii]